MKKHLKLFTFIVATGAIAGCASAQKTAKLEIVPLPFTVKTCQNTQVLEPSCIKASVANAALNAERGDYERSISQLKELVAKSPDDAYLYNNLGYAYYLSGNYKEAASVLGKAIVMDPTNVRALNNMGATLTKLGKTEHAQKYIALANTIKTGKIRPADEQSISSENVNSVHETPQQALAEAHLTEAPVLTAEPVIGQNQIVGEVSVEKNSPTEIRQVGSGIYEVVKTEIPAEKIIINTQENVPLPEVKLLAQSGGVSFKVDPLVNNLFNENALVMAGNVEFNNKPFTLKIINGNGIKGFARKTAETLAEIGLNQPYQLANKKPYNQYITVLQYKVGYRDEALQLAKTLIKMPVLVKFNIMPNGTEMRLVLGRDVINPNYQQDNSAV
jgi:tetratricopeptide (TPR) repeat protein